MASGSALSGYKVGEISEALLTKQKKSRTGKKENIELNALFSSPGLIQPQFVAVASKVRGTVHSICSFRHVQTVIVFFMQNVLK